MTRLRLTRADYEAVSHLTQEDAAKALGRSLSGVRQAAWRYKIKFADGHAVRVERLKARYAALTHLTIQEAAAQMNLSPHTVEAAARRYGLTFARPGRSEAVAVAPDPSPCQSDCPTHRPVPGGRRPRAPVAPPLPEGAMLSAPAWSTDRDALILQAKGRYPKLHALATRWGMPASRLVARWHVLRAAR